MQTVSPALFSVGTDERDLRPCIGPDHFVALALHKSDEVLFVSALFHRLPDVVHQLELPALALLRRTPFPRGQLGTAALVWFQYIQAVGHAHLVAHHAKLLQRIGRLAQLQPSLEADRVEYEMRMDVVGITMGGHQNFRPRPCAGGKLQCDFMGLARRDVFLWREGLHILIEIRAVHFLKCRLGRLELHNGIHAAAVDAADKIPLRELVPGLVIPHTVFHDRPHGADALFGFPDISHGRRGTSPLSDAAELLIDGPLHIEDLMKVVGLKGSRVDLHRDLVQIVADAFELGDQRPGVLRHMDLRLCGCRQNIIRQAHA